MIREVTRYKTPDGRLFALEQEAMRHAEELLLQSVEDHLMVLFPDAHRPSLIAAVNRLTEDRGRHVAILENLLNILNYGGGTDG